MVEIRTGYVANASRKNVLFETTCSVEFIYNNLHTLRLLGNRH
jgi:hypothetical protein